MSFNGAKILLFIIINKVFLLKTSLFLIFETKGFYNLWYRSQACALRVSDKRLYKFKGGDLDGGVKIAKNFLQHNTIKIAVVIAKSGADALQGELHGTV